MAAELVLIPSVLLAALAAELGLGLFVLERGEGRPAARFLGAFMVLHPMVFGPLAAWQLSNELWGVTLTESTFFIMMLVSMFIPSCLLAFALAYPTPLASLRRRPGLLVASFAPSVALAVPLFVSPDLAFSGTGASGVPLGFIFLLGYLILAAVVAAGLFWHRAQSAETDLKRRRLRYMAQVIAVPTAAVGSVTAAGILLFELGGPLDPPLLAAISALAVLPAFGLGYGVLKYQVLDLDLRVKYTIEKSTLVGAFGVTFLAVSEGVEFVLGVEGTIYGVGAAVAIGLLFRRIEGAADRIADALMPGVEDTEEHREHRKEEVYRTTLEEVLADGQMSAKDRRVLLKLQKSLDLDAGAASSLEEEVLDAMQTGAP